MKYFDVIFDEDQQDYQKYKNIRGEELYEFVAKYCYESLKEKRKPQYKLIVEIIKYEKRIKNILYTFFGTFEDYLKAQIYSKTIYKGKRFLRSSKDIFKNENEYFSSFSEINNHVYSLNHLIPIVVENKLINTNQENLIKIKDFRNQALHFNFLLFGKDKKGNEYNLETLKSNILLLKNTLPDYYGTALIKDINKTKNYFQKNLINECQHFLLEDLK